MIRPVADIRRVAEESGFTAGQIARACAPPLPPVTVWRVLSRRRQGNAATIERISAALDKLEAERREEAPAMGGTPSDRSNGAIPGQRSAARGGNPSQSDGDCGAGRRAHPPSLPAGRVMDDCLGGGEIAGEVEL